MIGDNKELVNSLTDEEFELVVDETIQKFDRNLEKNESAIDVNPFFALLEKAQRWDDLYFYAVEKPEIFQTNNQKFFWQVKTSIKKRHFERVEELLSSVEVKESLDANTVLELTLLLEKEKGKFTQEEIELLQKISHQIQKKEFVSDEQNAYFARTLDAMQTPLKWTVIESFLSSPHTQLFWKGYLVECWISKGSSKVIRFFDLFQNESVILKKEEMDSFYNHPIFLEIENLITKQGALDEEMKELLLQKAYSDLLRMFPFIEHYIEDASEWLERQLQSDNLILELYDSDEQFIERWK